MTGRSAKCFFLTGFMGVGKSNIGKAVADQLSFPFIDTDEVIENMEGCSISDIFHEKGEAYFRSLETEVLRELVKQNTSCIIATGGGVVEKIENRKIMRRAGPVIWLRLAPSTLFMNLQSIRSSRPKLSGENWKDDLVDLYRKRYPDYLQCDVSLFLENDIISDKEKLVELIEVYL